MNTLFEQSYYPISIAAHMTGYHRRTVEKLVSRGKVKARKQGKRTQVHLGSLIQHRKRNSRELSPLEQWLVHLAPVKRECLTYQELATLASADLSQKVTLKQTSYAFKNLRLPHHPHKNLKIRIR